MAEEKLELRPVEATVVLCLAKTSALDEMPSFPKTYLGRIAPNEALLIAPPEKEEEIIQQAHAYLTREDPQGLALPQTDAWTIWCLLGPYADEALSRLSSISTGSSRPEFTQGMLASIGSKIITFSDRTCIMVSSNLGHHVHDRVLELCHDLEPSLMPPWTFRTST